jgi:hypothetical protein
MESAITGKLLAPRPGKSEAESKPATSLTALAQRLGRLAAPALLLAAIAVPADAATLYRYINDKGYQEIGYSVPNHLVPNGYDVIGRLPDHLLGFMPDRQDAPASTSVVVDGDDGWLINRNSTSSFVDERVGCS